MMPTLSGVIDPQGRAIIRTDFRLSQIENDFRLKLNLPVVSPVATMAELDSGSTMCFVDNGILKQLGSHAIGPATYVSLHSGPFRQPCRRYKVSIGVSCDAGAMTWWNDVDAVGIDLPAQGVFALLGANFLRCCAFHYNGPASTFSLSF
jgi:hypothetical protein